MADDWIDDEPATQAVKYWSPPEDSRPARRRAPRPRNPNDEKLSFKVFRGFNLKIFSPNQLAKLLA
jgi:hypothetical protein